MGDQRSILLNELPDVVLEQIFQNLSYDEIARNRIVCKTFDRICKKLLNRGFNMTEKYHAQCLKAVKSQLPRRESERRNHSLARHCDVLTAIETRISMLSMTFTKYIDLNLCCFIPGKVIDEILRVLRLVRTSKTPPRTPEILQELRDISSMAMEHFDEKILPDFKNSICASVSANVNSYENYIMQHHSNRSKSLPHNFTVERINQTFRRIFNRTRRNKATVVCVKGEISKMKLRMNRQSLQMRLQSIKLQEHRKKIQEQQAQIAEMKKHLEEWEHKLGDLTAELSRAREEAQKPDALEKGSKRKISEVANFEKNGTHMELRNIKTKKRKLIVERKSSIDAKDVKFKKFMSELLNSERQEDRQE